MQQRSRISRLVESVPPSGIRRFFDIVSQMEDVITLGIGEPDFVTPWHIREAAIASLENGYTQYTSNWGLLELREEIARLLGARYGVEYRPEGEILVTVGVSEALDLTMRALLNPGDEVLIAEPCYVSYRPCVLFAGGKPVPLRSEAADGFRVTPEAIAAAVTPRTRALLLNYPSNPTGATFRRQDLERIAAIAQQHDLIVLSDEIYCDLSYDVPHTCFASIPGMQNRTVLLNGFSKSYAMTGWRVGYAAGPSDLVGAMTKIHQYTMLCAGITAQKAALEALRRGEPAMRQMVAEYDQRRRFFVSGLNRIGLDCRLPEGAFYAFPSVRRYGLSSEEFAERLLMEERVAVVPGTAFGLGGEEHVRCSYAASLDSLREALTRMERFVARLETRAPVLAARRGAVA